MARSRSSNGRFQKSRSPRRSNKSRSRKGSRGRYSKSPNSRSMKNVRSAMQDVDWKSGVSNTRAVIKNMNEATRLNIPASTPHMERLKSYGDQVLNMEYPTCPLGWERHTKSLSKVEKDYGVAWRDQDGYFCAPPGSDSPDTLVATIEDEKARYSKSPHELRTEIRTLSRDLRHSLNPEEGAKYEAEEEKRYDLMAQISTKQSEAGIKAAQLKSKYTEKENTKQEEKHLKMLEAIYRKRHGIKETAEREAKALLDVARECLSPGAAARPGPDGITKFTPPDPKNPSQTINVFVPTQVLDHPDGRDSNQKQPLQAWWRSFRSSFVSKFALEERAKMSKYM